MPSRSEARSLRGSLEGMGMAIHPPIKCSSNPSQREKSIPSSKPLRKTVEYFERSTVWQRRTGELSITIARLDDRSSFIPCSPIAAFNRCGFSFRMLSVDLSHIKVGFTNFQRVCSHLNSEVLQTALGELYCAFYQRASISFSEVHYGPEQLTVK